MNSDPVVDIPADAPLGALLPTLRATLRAAMNRTNPVERGLILRQLLISVHDDDHAKREELAALLSVQCPTPSCACCAPEQSLALTLRMLWAEDARDSFRTDLLREIGVVFKEDP